MGEENKIQRLEPASRALQRIQPGRATPYETVDLPETVDLRNYWRILHKRRWTVLPIFFAIFTIILIGTLKQTPIYRAHALLEIQKENPNIPSVHELFELERVSDTYLETQYRILASSTLARRVIEELSLKQLEEFNPPKRWWSSGGREGEKDAEPASQVFAVDRAALRPDARLSERVLQRFQERLIVGPIKRSRLVEVSFESKDAALAARVVNTLAANYIEQNLEARWEATQKATEWLAQQLLGLKARLEKSEDDLQEYAQKNGLLFFQGEQGNVENVVNARLRQLQEELTRAQAARYEKESLYRLVQSGDFSAIPGIFENRLMQDLTMRLAELQREYAQLTTTFTPDYPSVRKIQSQIDEVEEVLARERERAAKRIVNDYQAAKAREELLRRAFDTAESEANLTAGKSVQYSILKREVETNKQLYEGLLQRMKEAGISAGLKASNVRIVDPGVPPERPARPRVLLNLVLAVVLGLGMGVGAAFLQEYLDNTLKTSEDVERFLQVPALALIPSAESLNGRRDGIYGLYERGKLLAAGRGDSRREELQKLGGLPGGHRIDTDWSPNSALGEAFRGLRTCVLLSTAERPPRSLLVTSAQPGEGKTTVSTNLAISLAQLGQRVLLIDLDLRRPSVHKVFELPSHLGVVGYLASQEDWKPLVQKTSALGLDVLCCGPIPPNPAELLFSDRMRNLLRETSAEYDFVVLDSAPLLNVADSRILSSMAEGLVMVVKGGATPRELVQRAYAYVHDVGAHVIGVVLNNLDVGSGDYYYYRYYHSDEYGPQDKKSDEA